MKGTTICADMDGKHFKMEDFQIGVTAQCFIQDAGAVPALILMMDFRNRVRGLQGMKRKNILCS